MKFAKNSPTERRFAWVIAGLIFAGSAALAKPVPAGPKPSGLKRAYDALTKNEFTAARALATKIARSPDFSDYGDWINAQADYKAALVSLRSAKFSDAAKLAQRSGTERAQMDLKNAYSPFLKDGPRDLGLAEIALGDARMGLKQWKAARGAYENGFQRMIGANSLSWIRAESLTHYSQICEKQAESGDGLCGAWIMRFFSLYPRHAHELSAFMENHSDILDRLRGLHGSAHAVQPYHAPDLDQAAMDSAFALELGEKYRDAIAAFLKFSDEFPRSTYRLRARYWLARAYDHESDHDQAKKVDEDLSHDSPLTYYGLLATLAQKTAPDIQDASEVPMSSAQRDPALLPVETYHLDRGEKLLAQGLPSLAAIELKSFVPRDLHSTSFLWYLATLQFRVHNYNDVFLALGELIQRKAPGIYNSESLKMIFPIEPWNQVSAAANEAKVDPLLAISLIKQESGFDSASTSSSGAIGLSQLMHATALSTDESVTRAELLEPEKNLAVGMKYLGQLITRYKGNIVLAVSAYNAGPGNVDRWFKDFSGRKGGAAEFIETIPFRETREYVSGILRNYYWYAKLLGKDGWSSLDRFWIVTEIAPSPSPTE